MHEAALAVLEVAGTKKFWEYATALFAKQEHFFDSAVYDKTRKQIYEELAEIAGTVGVEAGSVMEKLKLTSDGNAGNAVTQRMKWATKFHRARSVHVTPTVFFDGLEAGVISSGWTPQEWQDFLDYHLANHRSDM
eukprot:gnl/TRDRNA2_/TRDRNA2_90207_c1_seq1.p1 gnl/TRDRNA2_/TRDRNA2_90207_c1~~gnl/TRDRNA2_/TRDRNA2_90207_c1_seq1.p1  ORF type:complete len:150 (+),score=32.29 gnl/TRDRNA2_/TRDRNA2_90207_c1_seq1:47-451(+)